MSLNFISIDVNKELDSLASYVFDDAEELMWNKMYLIAAKTFKREGYLEVVEGRPYTARDIALKIFRENKHQFKDLVVVIQSTIDKALKNDMLGISKDGTLYFKNWTQLSKEARNKIHKTMQAGSFMENGQVKPIKIDDPNKDKIITKIYTDKNPEVARQTLSIKGDDIKTQEGEHYKPYEGSYNYNKTEIG